MKSNFSIKFKLFDIFVISFVVICIIISASIIYGRTEEKNRKVEVYIKNELVEVKSISELTDEKDYEINIQKGTYGLKTDVKILVNKEKGVCIHEIECPNHICTRQGWVNRVGSVITCVPNSIRVIIVGYNIEDIDQPIELG